MISGFQASKPTEAADCQQSAGPHVGLARCYFDQGKQDSGLAELDKAAALTSSGPGWNTLAWTLAEHQIKLDRAEQYARLAVSMDSSSLTAVSARSANAKLKYGVSVPIMVILHTFGGRLNFNSHLHILVSAGGLQESEGRWVDSLVFDEQDKGKLMRMWRFAVITYLRTALKTKVLTSDLGPQELRVRLKKQYERWWSIDIDHFASKEHFLRYAGRYVRRPPIAQYRFLKITDREVRFWTKDKIQKRRVNISRTPEEFVATLAEHVPDRYQHGIRYFGLLAPRSKARTSAAVFALLGQQKRSRPRRLSWAFSRRRDFGVDPLIDRRGQPMRWVGRLKPRV